MTHLRLIPIDQELHDEVQGRIGTVLREAESDALLQRGFDLRFSLHQGILMAATHPAGIKPATW